MAMDRRVWLAKQLAIVGLVGLASLGLRSAVHDSGESSDRGSAAADACSSLSVGYVVDYVPRLRAYAVTGAELASIAQVCEGRTVRLTFVGDDGSKLAEAHAHLVSPHTTVGLPSSRALAGELVASVSVAVDS